MRDTVRSAATKPSCADRSSSTVACALPTSMLLFCFTGHLYLADVVSITVIHEAVEIACARIDACADMAPRILALCKLLVSSRRELRKTSATVSIHCPQHLRVSLY
jgi:hypothetical protein